MIRTISIRNLGVIEKAELEIGPGLTVLTGETGAGKTMVLTSLHLLMGGRADPGWVRKGAEKAGVDGIFEIDAQVAALVDDLGGDVDEDELIVSRTIAGQGRSRAHLGGCSVPAGTLVEVLSPLVTVHGQTDQLRLRSTQVQRETIDSHGGAAHAKLLKKYAAAWAQAVGTKKRLDTALADAEYRADRIEHLSAITAAISDLDPREGEEEELRSEAERLTNAEDLRIFAEQARVHLRGSDDEDGALDLARRARDGLAHASRFDSGLDDLLERLTLAVVEWDSIADEIDSYLATLQADPQRLAAIHERRAQLRRLMEGRAADIGELLRWYDDATRELADLTGTGSDPATLEAQLKEDQAEVLRIGEELSASRRKIADSLARAVDKELAGLAMKDAHFTIEFTPSKPAPYGLEEMKMLLQAHPSAPARPLGQGASGGELSRVMLALEVVLGARGSARTFIFDEVDAGIGGRTANEVASRLARLAQDRQVIVVTHLPQVAAVATTHLVVEKSDGRTIVRTVEGEERQAELVRMMGGDAHSEAARRHAAEVLKVNMSQSAG
ncbi:MAG: DNA repair protein RecN [Actinomycetaceae bacterium]|nr:DNA repair protein RecN [Actinomycetaceae bacterium]